MTTKVPGHLRDCQWLPLPITFAILLLLQDLVRGWGYRAELHRHLCSSLKWKGHCTGAIPAEGLSLRGDPTLSAAETLTQWHGELLYLGTSPAAVDDHNFFMSCCALSTPQRLLELLFKLLDLDGLICPVCRIQSSHAKGKQALSLRVSDPSATPYLVWPAS